MAKTLVLAEKPSVARDIARVLGCKGKGDGCIIGQNYIITWALGHLVTLADPDAYDDKYKRWNLEDLPMLPDKMKLITIKQTSKQYRAVSALMKREDVDKLVIATDAGREGELVARWIMMKAHCKKPAYRLWISSQTDKAIKEGFQSLKPAKEYDNLYHSAQARAEADWLVGLNTTRALTCKYNAQLSAGRVQTPTLALIVKREEEILAFQPKDYYSLQAVFKGFNATFRDKKNNTRFSDKAFVEKIAEATKNKKGTVAKVEKTAKKTPPPAAYDLTELQRDANKKYGYSAKQTLALMQSLYEYHKVLTYLKDNGRDLLETTSGKLTKHQAYCGDYSVELNMEQHIISRTSGHTAIYNTLKNVDESYNGYCFTIYTGVKPVSEYLDKKAEKQAKRDAKGKKKQNVQDLM